MPDIDVNLANPPLAPGPYLGLGAGSDWPKANRIPIGGTQAALQAHGVQLSLRYSF